MSDETIQIPPDIAVPYRVVTDATFPYGLRCCHCNRLIDVGQPFIDHVIVTYGNGDTMAHLACVYCPCDEGMEGAA